MSTTDTLRRVTASEIAARQQITAGALNLFHQALGLNGRYVFLGSDMVHLNAVLDLLDRAGMVPTSADYAPARAAVTELQRQSLEAAVAAAVAPEPVAEPA